MNQEDRKQWKQYIDEKAAVKIFHNNDTGEWIVRIKGEAK